MRRGELTKIHRLENLWTKQLLKLTSKDFRRFRLTAALPLSARVGSLGAIYPGASTLTSCGVAGVLTWKCNRNLWH